MNEVFYLFTRFLKVMQKMKKHVLAILCAITMVFAMVTPAYAAVHGNSNKGGSMNSVEEELLSRFDSIMGKYDWFTHRDQYYEEARAALIDSDIDLDSAAQTKFNGILDQIDAILATCTSEHDAWANHGTEIVGLVNSVSKSYKMTVSVDGKSKDATVMIDRSPAATTAPVVRQTGFGLGQTFAVTAGCAAALAGAFFIVRKNRIHA